MENKYFYCLYLIPEKREELIQKVNKLYIDMLKYQNDSSVNYDELIAKFDKDTKEYCDCETLFLGTVYRNKFTFNPNNFYDCNDIKSVMRFLSQKNISIYDNKDKYYTIEEFAKIIGFNIEE